MEDLQAVFSGQNPQATLTMLKHGLFWLLFAIALDDATSWVMMSRLGPLSEGSVATRLFFETRTLDALISLVANQWGWIVFVVLTVLALVTCRQQVAKGRTFLELEYVVAFGLLLSWLPGPHLGKKNPAVPLRTIKKRGPQAPPAR